jgi:hypothetical protein
MRTTFHKIVTELPKPLVKLIKAGAAEAAQEKFRAALQPWVCDGGAVCVERIPISIPRAAPKREVT